MAFEDEADVLYKFEYHLQDHLGNTRVVFGGHSNGKAELVQQTDYYPFGLVMAQREYLSYDDFPENQVLANKYLYNGKEWQDEEIGGAKLDWYDYGARFFDPELARFHTVDPKTEIYSFQSPYAYAVNNPIRFVDLNGESPGDLVVLYVVLKHKFNKWLGGMVDYTKQTSTSKGYRSMNAVEANVKGLSSQKAIADMSHIIAPVTEETNIAVGVGGDIRVSDNIRGGAGGEIGTAGIKIYAEGPGDCLWRIDHGFRWQC